MHPLSKLCDPRPSVFDAQRRDTVLDLTDRISDAIKLAVSSGETRHGLVYLKTELPDYWNQCAKIVHILDYLAALRGVGSMAHWHADAAADLLARAVRADHV